MNAIAIFLRDRYQRQGRVMSVVDSRRRPAPGRHADGPQRSAAAPEQPDQDRRRAT